MPFINPDNTPIPIAFADSIYTSNINIDIDMNVVIVQLSGRTATGSVPYKSVSISMDALGANPDVSNLWALINDAVETLAPLYVEELAALTRVPETLPSQEESGTISEPRASRDAAAEAPAPALIDVNEVTE